MLDDHNPAGNFNSIDRGGEQQQPPAIDRARVTGDAGHNVEAVMRSSKLLPRKTAEDFKLLLLDVYQTGAVKYKVGMVNVNDQRGKTAVARALEEFSERFFEFVSLEELEFIKLFNQAYEGNFIIPTSNAPANPLPSKIVNSFSGNQKTFNWGKPPEIESAGSVVALTGAEKFSDLGGKRIDLTDLTPYYQILGEITQGRFDLDKYKTYEKVRFFLQDLVLNDASDFHIQSTSYGGRIRHRRQNKMHVRFDYISFDEYAKIINSLCMLAGRDFGRLYRETVESIIKLRIIVDNIPRNVEFRFQSIYTSPLPYICLRVQKKPITDINKIGLLPNQINDLIEALNADNGMIVISGATGSGKTNTLNSCFFILEQIDDLNILEYGMPIEIESNRRAQITIKDSFDPVQADLYKKEAFKASLRLNPDVIAFTETRDADDAKIVLESASTGHTVFTTMHAANVEETLVRFFQMGLPRDILASSINCICAQRLVRTLCIHCRQIDDENSILAKHTVYKAGAKDKQGNFCLYCENGYSGMTAIAETLLLNEKIRLMIRDGKNAGEIAKAAIDMKLLKPIKEVAREKFIAGLTSESEVSALLNLKTEFSEHPVKLINVAPDRAEFFVPAQSVAPVSVPVDALMNEHLIEVE